MQRFKVAFMKKKRAWHLFSNCKVLLKKLYQNYFVIFGL